MSIGAIPAANPVSVRIAGQSQTTPTPAQKTSTTATTTASIVADALKEATETAAQTAQEASHGDRVAQKLVQKHQHHTATATAAPKAVSNGSGQPIGETISTKA
ncbi:MULTISPECIES: hypothetical protein [Pseudomonas]|uniref:hypothetical protein n=1 Tax=Pseudomonas TaxID=286 RepID=UPI000CD54EFC|nr:MULTISPECIES: hypothetical protein [Pseudomonas]RBH53668.1 hypothetical protein C3F00_026945 [Pseudomonas sp. MWU13-2860]